MRSTISVFCAILLYSCSLLAQANKAIAVSESLSIRLNPPNAQRIAKFYSHFADWANSLGKANVPHEVVSEVLKGNFCIRKDVWISMHLRYLDVEVGFTRDPRLDPSYYGIAMDSALQEIFQPISRPRDSHHIITLVDRDNKILYPSRYVLQAYSELEINVATSFVSDNPVLYYLLNESSLGGNYSLETLIVLKITDNIFTVAFDEPVLEKAETGSETSDYHCIYDVTPDSITMLRMDRLKHKETIEHYTFNGNKYVRKK